MPSMPGMPPALLALERCVESGRDAGSFASDLEVHARELLVVQTLGELPAELSLTEEADARLRAQAERVDRAVVVRLLELLGAALEGVRAGADPRTGWSWPWSRRRAPRSTPRRRHCSPGSSAWSASAAA